MNRHKFIQIKVSDWKYVVVYLSNQKIAISVCHSIIVHDTLRMKSIEVKCFLPVSHLINGVI